MRGVAGLASRPCPGPASRVSADHPRPDSRCLPRIPSRAAGPTGPGRDDYVGPAGRQSPLGLHHRGFQSSMLPGRRPGEIASTATNLSLARPITMRQADPAYARQHPVLGQASPTAVETAEPGGRGPGRLKTSRSHPDRRPPTVSGNARAPDSDETDARGDAHAPPSRSDARHRSPRPRPPQQHLAAPGYRPRRSVIRVADAPGRRGLHTPFPPCAVTARPPAGAPRPGRRRNARSSSGFPGARAVGQLGDPAQRRHDAGLPADRASLRVLPRAPAAARPGRALGGPGRARAEISTASTA